MTVGHATPSGDGTVAAGADRRHQPEGRAARPAEAWAGSSQLLSQLYTMRTYLGRLNRYNVSHQPNKDKRI
jgi:hypothetical protein